MRLWLNWIEHRPSKPRVVGSSPTRRAIVVGVAQLVELRIVVPVVVGSSPIVHPSRFKITWLKMKKILLLLVASMSLAMVDHNIDFALELRKEGVLAGFGFYAQQEHRFGEKVFVYGSVSTVGVNLFGENDFSLSTMNRLVLSDGDYALLAGVSYDSTEVFCAHQHPRGGYQLRDRVGVVLGFQKHIGNSNYWVENTWRFSVHTSCEGEPHFNSALSIAIRRMFFSLDN